MLFNSLTFIIIFLPVLFALYAGGKNRWKNGVLIITSLLFYAWGGFSYTLILVLSILINFLIGRQVRKGIKSWFILGLIINVGVLVTFKYLDFFIENINNLFALQIPLSDIKLPLGISFFTFQGISFLIDIYQSDKKETIRLDDTTVYLSFFPQLIAGPIIRYHDIIEQIRSRTISLFMVNSGLQRFIIGLFKKVVIANTLGTLTDTIMEVSPGELATTAAWLGIIAYTLQIYYDFSGYSDMAIGLGKMMGFDILENFNYPYISRSIREFWTRWHISLTNWFRDYVYIPLGGNRQRNSRTYMNLSIVFILTGLWHGATWGFVFWGVFHGAFMVIERLFLGNTLKKIPSVLSWIYTVLVVMIGWVFFRIENFATALDFLGTMFSFQTEGEIAVQFLNYNMIITLLIAIIFATPIYPLMMKMMTGCSIIDQTLTFIRVNIVIPVLFFYSIVMICASTYNPFIYFRF